jgi:predicted RNase H-like HicB family nuclease
MTNIREVIHLCLEEQEDTHLTEFVGLQRVMV